MAEQTLSSGMVEMKTADAPAPSVRTIRSLIVDADAHVNPSHDMWVDYLPENLRSLAPKIEHGEDCDYVVFEGRRRKGQPDQRAGRT